VDFPLKDEAISLARFARDAENAEKIRKTMKFSLKKSIPPP
jgi:hypothetical protein